MFLMSFLSAFDLCSTDAFSRPFMAKFRSTLVCPIRYSRRLHLSPLPTGAIIRPDNTFDLLVRRLRSRSAIRVHSLQQHDGRPGFAMSACHDQRHRQILPVGAHGSRLDHRGHGGCDCRMVYHSWVWNPYHARWYPDRRAVFARAKLHSCR